MARFVYRFFNGRWVDRLITQHRFESIASSPEALRIVRARQAGLARAGHGGHAA